MNGGQKIKDTNLDGGLSATQARIANAKQGLLDAEPLTLGNIATIDMKNPKADYSGHRTYNTGLRGEAQGTIGEKVHVLDLFDTTKADKKTPITFDNITDKQLYFISSNDVIVDEYINMVNYIYQDYQSIGYLFTKYIDNKYSLKSSKINDIITKNINTYHKSLKLSYTDDYDIWYLGGWTNVLIKKENKNSEFKWKDNNILLNYSNYEKYIILNNNIITYGNSSDANKLQFVLRLDNVIQSNYLFNTWYDVKVKIDNNTEWSLKTDGKWDNAVISDNKTAKTISKINFINDNKIQIENDDIFYIQVLFSDSDEQKTVVDTDILEQINYIYDKPSLISFTDVNFNIQITNNQVIIQRTSPYNLIQTEYENINLELFIKPNIGKIFYITGEHSNITGYTNKYLKYFSLEETEIYVEATGLYNREVIIIFDMVYPSEWIEFSQQNNYQDNIYYGDLVEYGGGFQLSFDTYLSKKDILNTILTVNENELSLSNDNLKNKIYNSLNLDVGTDIVLDNKINDIFCKYELDKTAYSFINNTLLANNKIYNFLNQFVFTIALNQIFNKLPNYLLSYKTNNFINTNNTTLDNVNTYLQSINKQLYEKLTHNSQHIYIPSNYKLHFQKKLLYINLLDANQKIIENNIWIIETTELYNKIKDYYFTDGTTYKSVKSLETYINGISGHLYSSGYKLIRGCLVTDNEYNILNYNIIKSQIIDINTIGGITKLLLSDNQDITSYNIHDKVNLIGRNGKYAKGIIKLDNDNIKYIEILDAGIDYDKLTYVYAFKEIPDSLEYIDEYKLFLRRKTRF